MRSAIASLAMKRLSPIPRAGQLIGTLVRAFELQLELPDAMAKAAQRYFAGKNVNDENRVEIHREIARVVADDIDLVGLVRDEVQESIREALIGALDANAAAWNDLASFLASAATEPEVLDLAAPLFILLATIDLALRVGAIHRLKGTIAEPTEDDVAWAFDAHPGLLLQRLREQSGLAVNELEKTGAVANTVRAWLHDGARPQTEYLASLARMLGVPLRRPEQEIRRLLTRHYALAAIARDLRPLLGNLFPSVVARFTYYATLTREFLSHAPLSEDPRLAETQIALHGVAFGSARAIVEAIRINVESEPLWRAALAASVVDWLKWLGFGLVQANTIRIGSERGQLPVMSSDEKRELLLVSMCDLRGVNSNDFEPTDSRRRAGLLELQGQQFLALHDLPNAVRCFRQASEIDSDNPHVHYALGASLWQLLLQNSVEPASVDLSEAQRELWLASRLAVQDGPRWNLPKAWDQPLVELGWMLLESRRLDEALAHTNVVKSELGRHTALSAYFVGQVHEERGEIHEAMRFYEESLRRDSLFALPRESLEACRRRLR